MAEDTKKIYTTSEIRNMTHEERIKNKDEIIEAINENRVVGD